MRATTISNGNCPADGLPCSNSSHVCLVQELLSEGTNRIVDQCVNYGGKKKLDEKPEAET